MSTHFYGEGNLGSSAEFREFPHGNDEPRRLLRLNVHFDNLMQKKDGEMEDRGGFWVPVELWHRDAGHWRTLYQKGMRVLVEGRVVREEWEDAEANERVTFKIEARRVAMLPYRIEAVMLTQKPREEAEAAATTTTPPRRHRRRRRRRKKPLPHRRRSRARHERAGGCGNRPPLALRQTNRLPSESVSLLRVSRQADRLPSIR